MPRLFWNGSEARSFTELLQLAPDTALNSPHRSVVPLLDFVRVPADALTRIGDRVRLDLADAAELRFEHPIPVQRGRGKASFTDLVVLTPTVSLFVEAKYTEPEYEPVSKWLEKGSENRREVLHGWLYLLAKAGRPVPEDAVRNLPYQLIHRAASACHSNRTTRVMAYLIFGPAREHYANDLRTLASLMGTGITMRVLTCPVQQGPTLSELDVRWAAGERLLATDVRRALVQGPLFHFGELSMVDARPA